MAMVMLFLRQTTGKTERYTHFCMSLKPVFTRDCGNGVHFIDEPTSGLDPTTANEIHKMILAEKEKGRTVFLTTHTMAEAEKLCDRIALIDDGKIIECDRPRDICRRYNHQRMLKIHLEDGADIEIPHNTDAADRVAELIRNGCAETIHTTEPNLETVFIELTGKELEV